MRIRPRSFAAGFTLVEAIMVMTITGIIAAIVAVFIRQPVEGYADSVRRAGLTEQADIAMRRIARDLRLALPNSVRLPSDGSYGFEFIITKSGGRYRDESDGSTAGNYLYRTGATSFDVLGPMPAMEGGDFVVVYNLGPGYTPADAYTGLNRGTIAGSVAITANPVALSSNPFPTQSPRLPSPNARFQIVDHDEMVVRYNCSQSPAGGEVIRYSGCSMATPSSCSVGTAVRSVLAGSTTTPQASCAIDYTSAETGRNGLLYIELSLRDPTSGERITQFLQIHVNNSP
jgi:MSHA biogenesis protein MshO